MKKPIPDIYDFDTARLYKPGSKNFMIIGNFFFQDEPFSIEGRNRKNNYKSGISDSAFFALMQEFAERFKLEIILAEDDTVVMTGNLSDFSRIQFENGHRFSYDFADAKSVESYITYAKSMSTMPEKIFHEVQLDG